MRTCKTILLLHTQVLTAIATVPDPGVFTLQATIQESTKNPRLVEKLEMVAAIQTETRLFVRLISKQVCFHP